MLCEKCNENEATVHYTEFINGVKSEHHLCAECAKESDLSFYSGLLDGEFPFASLIKGMLQSTGMARNEESSPLAQVVCPKCKMTYEEFTKEGRFGCVECYNVFGPLIVDKIKKIQGCLNHSGKKPYGRVVSKENGPLEPENNIELLKEQLKVALKMEEYEEAARLRDEIRLQEGKE